MDKKIDQVSVSSQILGSVVRVPYSIAMGFVVGAFVWIMLQVAYGAIDLVWGAPNLAWWYPIVVCTIGGLLIGLWESKNHTAPKRMVEVMRQVRTEGTYEIKEPGKALVSFLLPLAFGATVGPEAGLTGFIVVGCLWVGKHLKASMKRELFRAEKFLLYTAGVAGGFLGVAAVSYVVGGGLELPAFGAVQAGAKDIPAMILLGLSGWMLAVLFNASQRAALTLRHVLHDNEVAASTLCGLLLGLIGVVFPYVMFPGSAQSALVIETWQSLGFWTLFLTAILKVVMLAFCLTFGWHGGPFFPLIFCGLSFGLSMSSAFGVDPSLAMTCVVVSFISRFMGNPFMGFFFVMSSIPVPSLIWAVVPALIGGKLPLPAWCVAAPQAPQESKEVVQEVVAAS